MVRASQKIEMMPFESMHIDPRDRWNSKSWRRDVQVTGIPYILSKGRIAALSHIAESKFPHSASTLQNLENVEGAALQPQSSM